MHEAIGRFCVCLCFEVCGVGETGFGLGAVSARGCARATKTTPRLDNGNVCRQLIHDSPAVRTMLLVVSSW